MNRRAWAYRRHELQKQFPCNVGFEVGTGGHGAWKQRYPEMLDWCHDVFPADAWAHHGWREPLDGKRVPQQFVTFYFETGELRGRFAAVWGDMAFT